MVDSKASDIFTKVLRLKEPWFVEDLVYSEGDEFDHMEIIVSTRPGVLIPCPVCGMICKAHDRIQRRWKHMDMCEANYFISAGVPRTDCPESGVKQIPIPGPGRI